MTTTLNNSENDSPNWGAFYVQLGITGPKFLTAVAEGLEDYIEIEARGTDSFWSGELEEVLTFRWHQDPSQAVWETVKVWTENIKSYFDEVFGPYSLMPWKKLNIDEEEQTDLRVSSQRILAVYRQELIDELVAAAREPNEEDSGEEIPHLLIQGVVRPYEKHAEGMLIRAVEIPWRKIISHLGKDWNLASQISSRQWEELIAAAFHQAKYDEVILTPRSGDHGRDVIAIKNGVGSIRIINSVKALKPGNLVRYDDVRALAGVLLGDQKASKGIITTTSDFPPNIREDPYLARLMPFRLELMNGTKLKRWLADIAKT